MWIKYKYNEVVNTDFVQSFEMMAYEPSADDKLYYIKFYQHKNYIFWGFETEKEREEFHDGLCKLLAVQEVPMLKL